jgi:hypothetical protein
MAPFLDLPGRNVRRPLHEQHEVSRRGVSWDFFGPQGGPSFPLHPGGESLGALTTNFP